MFGYFSLKYIISSLIKAFVEIPVLFDVTWEVEVSII